MAVHLQAGAPATTALDLWILRPSTGLLVTPFALSYQIFDLSDAAKLIEPEQAYPAVDGDTQAVDLVTDKLGDGHFVARWAAPSDEPPGRHEIRWFVTLDEGGPVREIRETFDVIAGAVFLGQEGYALISELRADGVPATVSDALLQTKIAQASRFIERATHRTFVPYYAEDLPVNGQGTYTLRFDDPILALGTVKRNYYEVATPEEITRDLFVVFNRHITHGLWNPDDRADPRIEFSGRAGFLTAGSYPSRRQRFRVGQRFADGPQTYLVTGLFGYTDPDGSFVGGTPIGINEVCRRLVILWLTPLYTAMSSGNSGAINVKSESTRDQSVTYGATSADKAGTGAYGEFTGSVELDQLLAMYASTRVGMP